MKIERLRPEEKKVEEVSPIVSFFLFAKLACNLINCFIIKSCSKDENKMMMKAKNESMREEKKLGTLGKELKLTELDEDATKQTLIIPSLF